MLPAGKKNGPTREVPFGWVGHGKYPSHYRPFLLSDGPESILYVDPLEKSPSEHATSPAAWARERRRLT
jgi:hypothetical protein